jgi:hypothetical protein
MADTNDMTPQERSEFERWLNDLAKNAEAIERLQEALKRSPEFIALMGTYRIVPGKMACDAFKTVADFVVIFLSKELQKSAKINQV